MVDSKIKIIRQHAASSRGVLKKAFNRKSPRIAANLTALGKKVTPRTVRKMTEENKDVRRRNILENMCILLGACAMESPQTFEMIFQFLEAFAQILRGKTAAHIRNFDEAFSEYRFAFARADREFFRGDLKDQPELIIQLDQSLKPVFTQLNNINFATGN